jgi:hypothetical protein
VPQQLAERPRDSRGCEEIQVWVYCQHAVICLKEIDDRTECSSSVKWNRTQARTPPPTTLRLYTAVIHPFVPIGNYSPINSGGLDSPTGYFRFPNIWGLPVISLLYIFKRKPSLLLPSLHRKGLNGFVIRSVFGGCRVGRQHSDGRESGRTRAAADRTRVCLERHTVVPH